MLKTLISSIFYNFEENVCSARMPSLFLAHGLPSYALKGYPEEEGLYDAQRYVEMLS